jgi:hypothetical protein
MAPAWDSFEAICDSRLPYMKNPYWDGKVHKPVKFDDSFDPQTVEGRKRAFRLAASARRAKAELEVLPAEEQSSFWGRDPQMARAGLTLARSVPACSYLVRFERLAEGRAAVLSSHRALLRSSHLLL